MENKPSGILKAEIKLLDDLIEGRNKIRNLVFSTENPSVKASLELQVPDLNERIKEWNAQKLILMDLLNDALRKEAR